jgi:site-specific DNA-cytosine methylase
VGRLGEKCPTKILVESEDHIYSPKKHGSEQKVNPYPNKELDVVPICLRGRKHGTVIEFMKYFGCLRTSLGFARNFVWDGDNLRVLTPVEYERLQGIPDNHTNIPGATDILRWKAIGNAMSVPVVKWVATIPKNFFIINFSP